MVGDAIRAAAGRLGDISDTARLDAELLMAHALGRSRSEVLVHAMDAPAPPSFAALVERRLTREPVAHIVGSAGFYGLDFAVSSEVLIPRPDSEALVEAALEALGEEPRVLDLGTGSGALLLSVLAQAPGAHGIGIDASPDAVAVAQANAARLGLAGRAGIRQRDWHGEGWADDLGRFDCVLCNPPYVEAGAALEPEVRDHEPHAALFAGPDGLDDYRVLFPQVPSLLKPGGIALFEIGAAQGEPVSALARQHGLSPRIGRDLAGRDRFMRFGG